MYWQLSAQISRHLSRKTVVAYREWVEGSAAEAVRRTYAWFESHGDWSPPDNATLAAWMSEGICRCPDDCQVTSPKDCCTHGLASWWLVLRTLDRHGGVTPLAPVALTPHPDRLDIRRPDYTEVMDAHHQAILDGEAGYLDPTSGLFVQTARTLWDRGRCCEQGCRHCPFICR